VLGGREATAAFRSELDRTTRQRDDALARATRAEQDRDAATAFAAGAKEARDQIIRERDEARALIAPCGGCREIQRADGRLHVRGCALHRPLPDDMAIVHLGRAQLEAFREACAVEADKEELLAKRRGEGGPAKYAAKHIRALDVGAWLGGEPAGAFKGQTPPEPPSSSPAKPSDLAEAEKLARSALAFISAPGPDVRALADAVLSLAREVRDLRRGEATLLDAVKAESAKVTALEQYLRERGESQKRLLAALRGAEGDTLARELAHAQRSLEEARAQRDRASSERDQARDHLSVLQAKLDVWADARPWK
jgi:chromosome segregation ATPase